MGGSSGKEADVDDGNDMDMAGCEKKSTTAGFALKGIDAVEGNDASLRFVTGELDTVGVAIFDSDEYCECA